MTREQIEDIKIRWLGGRHSAEFERDLLALCDLALRGLERGWIPVSERLPDGYENVLCYWGDHVAPDIGSFHAPDVWQDANDNMGEFDAPPTHWMPLPAAPKEKP